MKLLLGELEGKPYAALLRKIDMYFIIWEFVVRPNRVREFVAAYKADGGKKCGAT